MLEKDGENQTDRVKNEEILHRGREKRNIQCTKRRKANWTGHMLRKNVIERKIERERRLEDEKEEVSNY